MAEAGRERGSGAVAAWNRFWFEVDEGYRLCLVRALFGLVLVLKLTGATGLFRLHDLSVALPRRGVFPVAAALEGFHAPYPWLAWLPLPSPFWFARIEEALLLLAVLLTVGAFTRVVAPLLAVVFSYVFFSSQLNFYHHVYFIVLALWVLAFTDCGRHYSVDALIRPSHRAPRAMTVMPVRMLQLLVCAVYLFTFVWKARGGWLDGAAMQSFGQTGALRGPLGAAMASGFDGALLGGLGWFTLAVEAALPFCLWVDRLRAPAIFAGVVLHLGIDASMHVNTFSYQMMASYVLFIHPVPGATVVLYDGRCGMCQRSRRWGRVLDWLGRVSWVDFHDPEVRELVPGLTQEQLEREMYVFTPGGRCLRGYDGWRYIMASFPLTFLPSVFLYVPPARWAGRRLYRYVADHRQRACELVAPAHAPDTPWRETLAAARLA